MATDDDKAKLAKLLQDLEVPEVKLPERCNDTVKLFRQKFENEVEKEIVEEKFENPYVVDKDLLQENERKLKELLAKNKRLKKGSNINLEEIDPGRPWRTNSSKEKLLRINGELKRHFEKSGDAIKPMEEQQMRMLVQDCKEETQGSTPMSAERLQEIVSEAKKSLPNFQYKVENSTATSILPNAHLVPVKET